MKRRVAGRPGETAALAPRGRTARGDSRPFVSFRVLQRYLHSWRFCTFCDATSTERSTCVGGKTEFSNLF